MLSSQEGRARRGSRASVLLMAVLLGALPATAHHAGAMFDRQKSITLSGTVRMFQWTNPHCWIELLVPGGNGDVEWSIEMGPPIDLFRNGWKPGTLKEGDKITVVAHPMRDTSMKVGLFVSATSSDGKLLGKD
jgi:hypothetical protein